MEQRRTHSGGVSNGFILGVIVGVVVTLLLITKKGRRILRELTDEGLSKVTSWEELLEEKIDKKVEQREEEKQRETDYVQEISPAHVPTIESENAFQNNTSPFHIEDSPLLKSHAEHTVETVAKKVATSGRRFFRGIPKRN